MDSPLLKLLSGLHVVIDERNTMQNITSHYRLYRLDIKQIMMFYWRKAMVFKFWKSHIVVKAAT